MLFKPKTIFIILFLLIILGCKQNNEQKIISYIENSQDSNFDAEYTLIDNSDYLKEINIDDLIYTIKNKGNAIIFIGRTKCHLCQKALPKVQTAAKQYEQTIYYLDFAKLKQDDYFYLIDLLSPYINTFKDNEKIISLPFVFQIKEGGIVQTMQSYHKNYDYE